MKYNDKPLISVIIPIYNVENYLRECLDSVINQTYHNLEIILVDDGSTDSSPLICEEYASIDHRVKIVSQKNKGLVGARKSGISIATGEIATFVDSDDWIDLNMYEVMVRAMVETEADIVTSGLIREYESYSIKDTETIRPGTYTGVELDKIIKKNLIDLDNFFRSNISIHIYNKLYERKLLLKNELMIPEDISVGEDAACVYPCVLEAYKITVINECFYHYRIRDNSIMGKSNAADVVGIKKLYHYLNIRFNEYSYIPSLKNQLNLLLIYLFLLSSPSELINSDKDSLCYYPQVKKGMRIIIYGNGRAAKALMKLIKDDNSYIIVDWLDKNSLDCDINKYKYDYIVIAVYLYSAFQDIYENLITKGVPKNKIANLDLSTVLNVNVDCKEIE